MHRLFRERLHWISGGCWRWCRNCCRHRWSRRHCLGCHNFLCRLLFGFTLSPLGFLLFTSSLFLFVTLHCRCRLLFLLLCRRRRWLSLLRWFRFCVSCFLLFILLLGALRHKQNCCCDKHHQHHRLSIKRHQMHDQVTK
uniref:Candidate secreted effector n=1 Tax=Meloidogyne incognita TaxID=6306 RepID=A0A914M146_MELIC